MKLSYKFYKDQFDELTDTNKFLKYFGITKSENIEYYMKSLTIQPNFNIILESDNGICHNIPLKTKDYDHTWFILFLSLTTLLKSVLSIDEFKLFLNNPFIFIYDEIEDTKPLALKQIEYYLRRKYPNNHFQNNLLKLYFENDVLFTIPEYLEKYDYIETHTNLLEYVICKLKEFELFNYHKSLYKLLKNILLNEKQLDTQLINTSKEVDYVNRLLSRHRLY